MVAVEEAHRLEGQVEEAAKGVPLMIHHSRDSAGLIMMIEDDTEQQQQGWKRERRWTPAETLLVLFSSLFRFLI